jgi:hypothetical protein
VARPVALTRARPTGAPDDDRPARTSFPPLTWALLAVFGLLLLGTLVGQFLLIRDQRALTADQRAIAVRQLHSLDPLLRRARPLVSGLVHDLPRTRASARRADRLVRTALPVVSGLDPADLTQAATATSQLAGTLQQRGRLERLLRSTITVLGSVRRTHLVARSSAAARLVPRLLSAQREALALQRRTFELQRQTLDLTRQLLAVSQDTGRHAASLDRKLGGELRQP